MLTGCNKQTQVSCSSADTQRLIGQLVADQAAKLTADKKYDYYDGSFVFGAVKIRAALDQIQMAVENIQTINEDANSNKKFCSGALKVTIPANMLADADKAREIQHEATIADYAKQFNIENATNVFTQQVEYKVQLTADGKQQSVDLETVAWANLLDQTVTSALLKPTLEVQESDHVRLNGQAKQESEPVDSESGTETGAEKLETGKVKAAQEKQGLARLRQEMFEAEQVQKELLQEQASGQAVPLQPSASATTAKPISPSFNCAKAARATELAICANPDLAALDIKNMGLYLKAKSVDAVATKEIWKQSIKSKYACGADAECIEEVYNHSIADYGCIAADNESDCGAEQ